MADYIAFKELTFEDIEDNLLDNFNRYQKVTKSWKNENNNWILVDIEYIVEWDKNKKENLIKLFSKIINEQMGYVFGAYENKKLIGFSVLLNNKFGSKKQYIQLKFLHISLEYRHKGTGKKLFGLCVEKAKIIGIEKIYISANDSEDTIKFYFSIGCKDAMEINKEFAEEEPYDRPLEYKIE